MDRAHLDRLRRGEPEPLWEIDLHGFTAAEARVDLREALLEAWQEGARCGLIIHGRGRGSDAGPVLREGLAEWITAPPVGERVMAFTPARPVDGGDGATYVLLRRKR
jgi:DNA-nicking Smr family endonuclease